MYKSGSYFGDNDILLQHIGYRSLTSVCEADCQMYTITKESLEQILE